jgi:glycosyltransferase involved in cell wall biosynthesis
LSDFFIEDPLRLISNAIKEQKFKEAERRAVEFLQENPVNSQAWVFLGEALMLQGFKETACKVFERAWILDPEATWVQSVFSLLSRIKNDEPRLDIEMMMDAPTVTVSAAMIVKDEERCIARSLASISDAVDEIIVVDTGSTDRTIQIAQQFPKVKLYTYEWNNDFAAARNECLKYVTSDWVICVDADEYLLTEDIHAIKQATAIYNRSIKPVILRIGKLNQIRDNVLADFSEARLFQMNKQMRYWGRVHEQIGGAGGILTGDYHRASVRVRFMHDGYEPDIIQGKRKIETRLHMLKLMIQEEPDNPIWLMFCGRETLYSGKRKEALVLLLKALEMAEIVPEFGRGLEILMLLVHIYMSDDLLDEAEEACHQALHMHYDYPDAHYWLGIIELKRIDNLLLLASNDFLQAKSNYTTYRGLVTSDVGLGTWRADEALADIAFLSGDTKLANAMQRKIKQRQRMQGNRS